METAKSVPAYEAGRIPFRLLVTRLIDDPERLVWSIEIGKYADAAFDLIPNSIVGVVNRVDGVPVDCRIHPSVVLSSEERLNLQQVVVALVNLAVPQLRVTARGS